MEVLKIGIIGAGFMGKALMDAIKLYPNVKSKYELVAVNRRNPVKLQEVAKEYGVPMATTDYREILKRGDIDVVGIFTPDHLHAQHVLDSLDAGKHVICTKPLATKLEDLKNIVKKVDSTGLKFLMAETVRFHPLFLTIKDMFDKGEFGDPVYIQAHYVHDLRDVLKETPWRRTAPQDFLIGGGCHPISLVRWFAGEVAEVHAYANKPEIPGYEGYPLELNFALNLKFDNQCIGRVLSAHGCIEPPVPMSSFWLFGTRGSVVENKVVLERDGEKIRKTLEPSREMRLAEIGIPSAEEEIRGHAEECARLLVHFYDCVVHGKSPDPDVREGAKDVAVALAAWESIKKGLPVKPQREF
ncbi:Gfo/Idh/MocA family oxidoreductase [Candidatus Bathyarchaeota archaeon]|nr:Gfo/Idh/MocA family oxidoreductase [Candidatus Bathyarchaeota archaeon]